MNTWTLKRGWEKSNNRKAPIVKRINLTKERIFKLLEDCDSFTSWENKLRSILKRDKKIQLVFEVEYMLDSKNGYYVLSLSDKKIYEGESLIKLLYYASTEKR